MSWLSSSITALTGGPAPAGKPQLADAQDGKALKTAYYLSIIRLAANENGHSEELVSDANVSMYGAYAKSAARSGLLFAAKLIAERTPVGQRQRVVEGKSAVYAYNTSFGFCAVLIVDAWEDKLDARYYDVNAATLLSKTVDGFKAAFPVNKIKSDPPSEFKWPKIAELRAEAERIHLTGIGATQRELDETKVVLQNTINQVLLRGEKLEDLVAKSDDLSTLSKGFYKQSKAQNSCCVVM